MQDRANTLRNTPTTSYRLIGIVIGVVLAQLAAAGCASQAKKYTVRRWGSMHEVLAEGHTQGRVNLADFEGARGTIGVGALGGLAGEVMIADGDVWCSRVDANDASAATQGVSNNERATMLVAARVPRWRAIPVHAGVPSASVENLIADSARDAGFNLQSPVPFMITGEVLDLGVHVMAGGCPMAASHGDTENAPHPPFRKSWGRTSAKLVGFVAEGLEGTVTHHGSRLHVHALIESDPPIMGHVDQFGIAAGAVLFLPDR